MELGTSEWSIKIIPFDGKDKEWREWSAKFLARENLHGYKDVLLGNMKVPPEEKESLKDSEALARECNLCAYSNLILSCKGVPFSIVDGAKTKALPNGDARIAWIALKERYQVENATSKVELKRQFNELVMTDGQEPDDWFMEMDHLRNRLQAMESIIQDEDYVAHVLTNLTNEYSELVTVLEGDLEDLTIQKLRERVGSFYRRKQKLVGSAEDNSQALIHIFKGRCNNCGTYGHKRTNCPKRTPKKDDRGNRGSVKICHYCKRAGHIKKNCFKLKNEEKNKHQDVNEIALVAKQDHQGYKRKEVWYADSGASRHMTHDMARMFDIQENLKEKIVIGDGTTLFCKIKGSIKLRAQIKGSGQINVLLKDVLYIPELKSNLFSLSAVTINGKVGVCLEKDNIAVKGLTKVPLRLFKRTKDKTLYHMDCERITSDKKSKTELENGSTSLIANEKIQRKIIDVNIFHKRLGHPSEFYTRKTAEKYNVTLKGKMKVCEACTRGKGKQKPVKKFTQTRTSIPLERIFVDTSELPSKSLGGSKYWIMVVDDATRFKWSFFVKSKAVLGDIMQKYICKYVNEYNIKYLRCDNAGENQALK